MQDNIILTLLQEKYLIAIFLKQKMLRDLLSQDLNKVGES